MATAKIHLHCAECKRLTVHIVETSEQSHASVTCTRCAAWSWQDDTENRDDLIRALVAHLAGLQGSYATE